MNCRLGEFVLSHSATVIFRGQKVKCQGQEMPMNEYNLETAGRAAYRVVHQSSTSCCWDYTMYTYRENRRGRFTRAAGEAAASVANSCH